MGVENEYQRIKKLFENCDEKQLELIDGAILEAARLKVELDDLHEVIRKTKLLKVNPSNLSMQRELPVSKLIVKVRANYLNYIAKLANILGSTLNIEEDEGLNDYE